MPNKLENLDKNSMKTIYLEPDEEITSVVDMLTQVDSREVALIIPTGAQILQSSINLKLLKREANILNKDITIVTADELGFQMAQKANFKVKDKIDPQEVEDFSPEFVRQPEQAIQPKEDIIDALTEEMEIDKNSQLEPEGKLVANSLSKSRKKPSRPPQLSDILRPSRPKTLASKSRKKIETAEIEEETVQVPIISGLNKPKLNRQPEAEGIEPEYQSLAGPQDEETQSSDDFDLLKELESPVDEPVMEEKLMEPQKPSSSKSGFLVSLLTNKFFYIFTALVVVIAGILAYTILPRAEVIIFSKTERVTFDLSIEGSKNISQIDIENKKIPIQSVKALKTLAKEFSATGEKQLNEKAKGSITVYNEYSSEPQTLVASTRFLSANGRLFRIIETITVPGAKVEANKIIASALDVEVIADQPGSEYNIGPSDFTIPGFKDTPKYAGFYGRSKEPMAGGSTEKIKVVTAQDIEEAEKALTKELDGVVKKALEEQIPTDLRLIEGAIEEEIISASSSIEEDEEADTFMMEITAQSKALLFNEKDLEELVDSIVASEIKENQVSLPETQQISWDKPSVDWSASTISFSLHVQEDVAWQIDEEELKNDLAGLNEVEARKYLGGLSNLKKAQVTFWPFWVRRIPDQVTKITVKVQ